MKNDSCRYNIIRKMDISNGEGIGISIFFQGCPIRCKNCHNPETWDYDKGKSYTKNTEREILELLSKKYISRISILGGEPLISRNLSDLISLCKRAKETYPDKKIWLWSGYEWEKIIEREDVKPILQYIDILVAGPYIDEQRNITLKWRGSSNQMVIDLKATLHQDNPLNKPILYCE